MSARVQAAESGQDRYMEHWAQGERWTCCGAVTRVEHGRVEHCACELGAEHGCPLCDEMVSGRPFAGGLCAACTCEREGCDVVEDETCPRCGWEA